MEGDSYNNTFIYKLQHKEKSDLIYIGHTTNFDKRIIEHKSCSLRAPQKLYVIIRENGGWDCFTMSKLEEFSCNNKLEALSHEDKVIREMNPTMNSRTAKLKNEVNALSSRRWREKNKEKINMKVQCECGCRPISHRNMIRHRASTRHAKNMEKKIDFKI